MSSERILLKLTPKTSSIRPPVDGERANLLPEDVAGALGLAHAEPVELLIAYCLVCGDDSQRTAIEQWLTARAIRLSDRWPERVSYATKATLARLALEIALPTHRCVTCRGRGEVPDVRGIPEVCPGCEGRGYQRISVTDITRALGVTRWQYYARWRSRLYELVGAFDQRHKSLIMKVRKQLAPL